MAGKPHDPGRMRTFARLEAATLSPDGAGGHDETWIALANVPIEIEPVSARSDFSADQLRETASHRAIFRRRTDVASGMRLVVRGRVMAIMAIADLDDSGSRMVALLKGEGR